MNADDPRHGKSSGYVAGCREQCCRDAIAAWTRHRRTRLYLYGPLMVNGVGTRRRIRALMALGWSTAVVDTMIGRERTYTANLLNRDDETPLRLSTAKMYAEVYDRLSMTLPPQETRYEKQKATRCRNYARKQGWPAPLAWDEHTIDDPAAKPYVARTRDYDKRSQLDEAVVIRVLSGENLPTSPAEKREVMRRWLAAGRSEASLCAITGWQEGRYSETSEVAA